MIRLLLTFLLISGAAFSQKKSSGTKSKIKSYRSVITKSAKSDDGIITVHEVDEKFYYEVPMSLLGKDMLLVTRIKNIPAGFGGGYVNAGSKRNTQLVYWHRFKDNIQLKVKSYSAVADSNKAIFNSVQVNNYDPVLASFPINAFGSNNESAVIDVTDFFTSDIKALSGLNASLRKQYKVKRLDKKRSFINRISAYPKNVEVIQEMTYDADAPPSNASSRTITMQMNQSMILLPETPMMPRIYDKRVGWFTVNQIDYSSMALKADEKTYIRRWRLEPKDPAAYARGELVEPVKPIVYYLDPGTPEHLVKYIKQGVEDWQPVFETAGFKNAIIAKEAPTKEEDPEFSMEDIRYSSVRYVASTTRNATGPSVSDPRSGEIIESDIIWYHNHLRSYRNRYLLETGAANPSARTLNTPAEEIGEMMRMVIAHEIGHALGLPHNMRASFAYPVEKLRDGAFTQKMGIAATIMDYARYNYIAQPGDQNIRFIRQIGPYDHYAINWGYRIIPNVTSPEDEVKTLDQWIESKGDDPIYKFGDKSWDPASQRECIGDDPIKASDYGIKNLKYVAANLPKWTSDQTNNFADLSELYGELLGVWSRYVGHVVANVGGVYEIHRKPAENKPVYTYVDKATQQKSLKWVAKNAFDTPSWLLRADILKYTTHAGYAERLRRLQARHLNNLMTMERIGRLMDMEAIGGSYYSAANLLSDLTAEIFREAKRDDRVDIFRRNLQRTYVQRLTYLMTAEQRPIPEAWRQWVTRISYDTETSDLRALVRGELKVIHELCDDADGDDTVSKRHYADLKARIETLLDED